MSQVYNLTVYQAAKGYIEKAPHLIKELNKFETLLRKYALYPPAFILLQHLQETKFKIEKNLRIAERAYSLKGKINEY